MPLPWIVSDLPVVNRTGFPSHAVVEIALKVGLGAMGQGAWEKLVENDAGGTDPSQLGGIVLAAVVDHG